jgi:formylglycine-generating enzyme required for sulfatase activity
MTVTPIGRLLEGFEPTRVPDYGTFTLEQAMNRVGASLLATALWAAVGGPGLDAVAQRTLTGGAPPLTVAASPMVEIPGGTYTLGSERGRPDERPVHTVMLAPFRIDRYEATNAQLLAFLAAVLANPAYDIQLAGEAVAWHGR